MRQIIIVLSLLFTFSSCVSACPHHDAETRSILRQMRKMYEAGFTYFGHQDDLMLGLRWSLNDKGMEGFTYSDTYDVCGKYPALLGADLSWIEDSKPHNEDYIKFEKIKGSFIEQHNKGGYCTLSWHTTNPITGELAWAKSDSNIVHRILYEDEFNEKFIVWLDRCAAFLNELRDESGSLIPILFRPWHEYNSCHFWWGYQNSDEDYIALWRLTYDRLVNHHHLYNLIWVFSPHHATDAETLSRRYPGDRYVDIIAYERYQFVFKHETQEQAFTRFRGEVDKGMTVTEEFARMHHKMVTMAETGYSIQLDSQYDMSKWWTEVLAESLKGHKCLYILTWNNQKNAEYDSFSINLNLSSSKDFTAFSRDARMLFRIK